MKARSPVVVVLAIVLALLLVACGGTPSTEDQGDSAGHGGHMGSESMAGPVEGALEVTVTAVDIDFQPDALEIAAGEPVNVKIVNEGEAVHDFTLEAADLHVNVEPGENKTTSFTIDEPGTYEAKCTVPGHADAGMTIEVTVSGS